MMYRIYYGEITEARKKKWDNGEDNPYSVLARTKNISCVDWISFLAVARRYFVEEIQVDWGSFAWKATKDDILKLKSELNAKVEDVKGLKSSIEYGVVFIEEC